MDNIRGGTLEQGRIGLSWMNRKKCVHPLVNLFMRNEDGASPVVSVEQFSSLSKLINVTSWIFAHKLLKSDTDHNLQTKIYLIKTMQLFIN